MTTELPPFGVDYLHILTAKHTIVRGDGAPLETLLLTDRSEALSDTFHQDADGTDLAALRDTHTPAAAIVTGKAAQNLAAQLAAHRAHPRNPVCA